ncbi:MAG: peptidase M28, partial [Leifsonia flava]
MFERRRVRIGVGAAIATGAMIAVSMTAPAQAANPIDTQALRDAVSAEGIIEHLEEFQAIAEANG